MSAETWVKVLFTYGPLPSSSFCLRHRAKLRRAIREAATEQKRFVAVYVLNWGRCLRPRHLLDLRLGAANLNDEPTIPRAGRAADGLETLADQFGQPLLPQSPPLRSAHAFEWRSSPREARRPEINITVDPSTCSGGEGEIIDYGPDYQAELLRGRRAHLLRAGQKKMFVEGGRQGRGVTRSNAPLVRLRETDDRGGPSWSLFGTVAHAQSPARAPPTVGLRARARIARRHRPAQRARRTRQAGPVRRAVDRRCAGEAGSSYRLRLGGIAALNNMQGLRADALRPAAVGR